MAHLKRSSSLFFIPLEPYPARSARHLPHAGKALSVVILFPHMRVFALTMREKRHPRIAAFPIGEGGPRQRCSGALVNGALETISLALFYPASLIQPPPLRGTSFHRKEGVSTRAPSLGRGCRAQRGGVGFLFRWRSRLLFAFPIGEGFARGNGILVSSSIPRKNDRLLRAVVFMCITCLGKR